jgi:hypothetical protein
MAHIRYSLAGFVPSSGMIRGAGCLKRWILRWCLDGLFRSCIRVTRSLEQAAEAQVLTATHPLAAKGGEYFELSGAGEFYAHSSSVESHDTEKVSTPPQGPW